MALSAQDLQRAFTVDAPIGEYITKGIADVKAAREAREKKELEQQKFVYEEIDPLSVGTGTPDDPYIVSLVADAQQQIAKLPRNLTPGQHYARVMQILSPIKGRRQEAVMLKNQIEKQAASQHEENPLVKPKVIAADAIKNAYFNPDGTPKTSLDFNQDHVASVLSSGDLKYYDMNLAQANAQKWSTDQVLPFAGKPSATRAYTSYTGKLNPFFTVQETAKGAMPEQIYEKGFDYTGPDGKTQFLQYDPALPKMLPKNLYDLAESNPGYKLLIKRNFNEFRKNPNFNRFDDAELKRAAAYEAIRQATDLSAMSIQDEVNRPPARGGDGGGGGSTTSTPKPDINWFNMPQYIAQGGAPDVTTHMGPQTTTNAGLKTSREAISNILESGRNPNMIGGKGLAAEIKKAYEKIGADQATEAVIDISGQAPNKKFIIGYSDINDQFGNPKPILGKAKFIIDRNGSQVLKVYDENDKVIKSYDYTKDPVAAQDQFSYDFGPYNSTNTFESNQQVRTRPNSAATRIGRQTSNQ
jgi:hypothetical protein